jgi:TonB family protein
MKRPILLLLTGFVFASCQQSPHQDDRSSSLPDSSSLPAFSPVPVEKPFPIWPDILMRADVEGQVDLSLLVNESGRVIDVRVEKSINAVIDSSSVTAAWKWRFKPGRIPARDGIYRDSQFWVPVSFDWRLHDTVPPRE